MPSIASALSARYLMVLTDPSDPSRARHRPGLHCELAAIAPGAYLHVRSRRVTTSIVPLELSSELCPSSNLLGRSGWVRKSSTAARYTLSANFRSEQMKANRFVRRLQPIGSQEATSVHQSQHRFTESNTSSPNATQGCKTRQVGRDPISGPPSGPSGSPQSPAEPHPPSLAWVETLHTPGAPLSCCECAAARTYPIMRVHWSRLGACTFRVWGHGATLPRACGILACVDFGPDGLVAFACRCAGAGRGPGPRRMGEVVPRRR